jgi:ribonucleotide monophosphatase NagD (HAD superfamily)
MASAMPRRGWAAQLRSCLPLPQLPLLLQGLDFVDERDVPYCASSQPWDMDELAALQINHTFSAVVIGFAPQFNYRHLCYAACVLRETPGCTLVATNPDTGDRIAPGWIMPGTGCLVAALDAAIGRKAVRCLLSLLADCASVCTLTTVGGCALMRLRIGNPAAQNALADAPVLQLFRSCTAHDRMQVVVGKGGDWLLPFLMETKRLDARTTCIVGDRLDTDITLGLAGGFRTVLPLTGVCTEADVAAAAAGARPDCVVPSLASMAGL